MSKTVDQMSEAERDRTEKCFDEARSGMIADEVILEGEIEDAPPGPVRNQLLSRKGELLHVRAVLDRSEEAFFTRRTLSLDPPSNSDISEAKRLTQALGDRIVAEKSSQAVVKLLNDLSNFVTRVLS